METKNFQELQNELNQTIINEVKSAVGKLPAQKINLTFVKPHIIVTREEYNPVDIAVDSIWIDKEDILNFKSGDEVYDEYDGLLNIADLQCAITYINETIAEINANIEKIENTINPKYYHLLWPESQDWMEHEQAIPSEDMSCFIPCDVYDK